MNGSPSLALVSLWQAGVDAVGGYASVAAALQDQPPAAPDQIIAVGKAAGAMAQAALDHLGQVPALVVTKDGHGAGLPSSVRLIEAAHPVPDGRSLAAGRAMRETVQGMADGSRLLLLVSGGASSLAEDLVDGKTLNDLMALNRRLLGAGMNIEEMNIARRAVSRIKGGGLLGMFGGTSVRVLAISDVPGDKLAVIGSGIGVAPEHPGFDFKAEIVASNGIARDAVAKAAKARGLAVLACEEALHDDLDTLATGIGQRLRDMQPGVMILGGEPTVVLPRNPGRGGRNQALALALAREIAGVRGLSVLVAGTDGSDGPTEAAGAVVDGSTWGPGAGEALKAADSGTWLERKGALLITGPTGTNVMDLLIAMRA